MWCFPGTRIVQGASGSAVALGVRGAAPAGFSPAPVGGVAAPAAPAPPLAGLSVALRVRAAVLPLPGPPHAEPRLSVPGIPPGDLRHACGVDGASRGGGGVRGSPLLPERVYTRVRRTSPGAMAHQPRSPPTGLRARSDRVGWRDAVPGRPVNRRRGSHPQRQAERVTPDPLACSPDSLAFPSTVDCPAPRPCPL